MYHFNMTIHSLSLTRLYGLLAGIWLIAASPLWMNQLATSFRGDWADAALSDVLSHKYGSPVSVRNVHFERWCSLRFGALAVDSREGKPLVRASGGALRLNRLDLSPKGTSETEIRFENIFFTKDYYGSSQAVGNWKYLMRKPIHVQELCFLVKQSRSSTTVTVRDCRSEGVRIAGGVSRWSVPEKCGTILRCPSRPGRHFVL